ncbi:pentatricopeptide repeat-containing protein [Quercus suber]|uniref:Pentatricopeptide repeat-containing protein n=1 Tax=Quercus suber TaxID=58331 RepID=A0AAW0LXM4_QUESU
MGAAKILFDEMTENDELTWTTMITGYERKGDLDADRAILDGMTENMGVARNAMISGYVHRVFILEFIHMSVISACTNAGLFKHGKQVHVFILKEENPKPEFLLSVNNALVMLYWKCGKDDEARKIFDKMLIRNLVSWNAILSAYVNLGRIVEAKSFFKEMPERNLLAWTMMISGLAQNGFGEEGLKLFNQMRIEGFEPYDFAFAGEITSCAHGRQLHAQLAQLGHDTSLSAGNANITMYVRCGIVEAANCVFLTMPYLD